LKILYWSGLFWPHIGGAEVISQQLITALQQHGYEFLVITSLYNSELSEEENYKGITIYRLPFHKGVIGHNLKEIERIKQRVIEIKKMFKPDLIHINSIDSSIFFHQITDIEKDNIPALFTVHSLPSIKIDNNTLIWKVITSSKWVTTASEAMLQTVRKLFPEIDKRSSLIYYGLNVPEIKPEILPINPPRLLCIGRIVKEKGFDIALTALADVITLFPTIRLIITGDGHEKEELWNLAEKLGIAKSVEFTGWIPPEKVPELINTVTAVIVPSRWEEPFGLVALQAAQMTRPVIAACSGGLSEIVEHKKTGLLFEKENVSSLSEQIIFLLKNPELAIKMGEAARTKASQQFAFANYVDSYDNLYKQLVNHCKMN
jgi:glycogen(starch) synthase